MIAPGQLPFAPRPIRGEVLSSWLMRVAAANLVQLVDLLEALETHHGQVLASDLLDYSIPEKAVTALSKFCRISRQAVRDMDIRRRAPQLDAVQLMRYEDGPRARSSCLRHRRVRYTFCPLCLVKQRVIHTRWDWSVACITLCDVHQTPLLDECPACGETDPLSFSGVDLPPDVICRSCYKDLACGWPRNELAGETRQAVDGTYRASLLGVDPGPEILGKSTAQQFRAFIEDLHQVLRHKLNLLADCRRVVPVSFSRHDILHIIALLIRNAAPTSDLRLRRKRESRSVALWTALFQVIPARFGGVTLEDLSSRWPKALRRRFASAMLHRTRKRWPYSPWGPDHDSGIRFKYMELARVYELSTVNGPHIRNFQI
jgi:TniQ protein